MARLTDTQRVLLSAAAARKNLSLFPAPESLTSIGNALDRAIAGIVKCGLATEARARSEAANWRRDDEGVRIGLVITPAGLAAIGVDQLEGAEDETRAGAKPVGSSAGRPGGRLGAILKAVEAAGGATIGELAEASAWQPHTTRAALTRLRQRGFDIRLEAIGERKAYRLQAAG